MLGPVYPNQQLRAVGLETYFKGRVGFRTAAERIQRQFEDRLAHLFVPNATAGQALDLQPYQLRDEAGLEALGIAVNQASYVAFQYPGHDAFLTNAFELLPAALGELGVTHLERVAYRYENEIDFGRDEKGAVPIHLVLRSPKDSWWADDRLSEFSCSWTQLTNVGRLAIRTVVESQEEGSETLKISIASVVTPAGPVGDLRAFAMQAHDEARNWFEGAITEDFRRSIRGDSHE